ncbi:DUF4424 family protein [Bradyrhizobium sp. U87765 SZCCT0131]|uniref:DUF4424 family protein n=1 Tax=unclassified Bradyrhizobium TaxID=2631580 RepID=UPI001BA5F424|nr:MULTISPECIES: DUF4424 family protein [unclassified Bradyrhizobium]MBR1218451.1 DUF4424 family protein [Bradyrhizobium sp. U87765 SZCCT0131]MBR1260603.1 DUF4424 family protein [Bradyrhizobium sp. U87765 SZCCT0134]MBR1303949.1 DUF4424 family protein [Bradyrhizobium sp. U87765 SZCCT0110]MBR1319555.1 DUF4424 family protein [Bradyrhizobium sp. U87765 SZCCT0109]MBR1347880.1 DUF4424 family protein [Bradyrhizobium sp. U87765 SZCCT0048]
MAVFAAGGLQFQPTSELRMTSEDLYLSPLEVRVSYTFLNLTGHDVSGTVAFPMPEISVAEMSERPHKFHGSSLEGDIFDFHVEAAGELIKPQADIYAFVKDRKGVEKDVTEVLRKYRVPVIKPDPTYSTLTTDEMKALVAAGVVDNDEDHHPLWSVRTTFHWQQTFPAGQSISITHRYKPIVGGSWIRANIPSDDGRSQEFCFDKTFARSAQALPADDNGMLGETQLEYILKTGANWAGPIGTFRLEIAKGSADLVSLCPIPGLKLEWRSQSFIAEAKQYTPTTDIKLLFLYRACDKAPCQSNMPSWPGLPR